MLLPIYYVIIQKTVSPRKLEEDVMIKFCKTIVIRNGKTFLMTMVNPRKSGSSRLQMFFKIGILKNFANFTGKHVFWSLF